MCAAISPTHLLQRPNDYFFFGAGELLLSGLLPVSGATLVVADALLLLCGAASCAAGEAVSAGAVVAVAAGEGCGAG